MSGGSRKPDPPVPPGKAPEDDELLSSEELFGELVDAPLPRRDEASREQPIKVQVRDPVTPAPFATAPEDAEDTPTRTHPDEEVDDAFSRLGSFVAESIFRPAGPVMDDEEARLPPAAIRTGAKLSITDPKIPAGPGLDLASVAESALEERAAEPAAEPPRAEPAPARVSNWRDDHFGPYELVDRVAIGGMAEVFKAKRTGVEGFEKTVALKRILPHLSDNKEFLDMFVDEAKMVAGLAHPNIVQIYDLGRIEPELLHRDGVRARARPAHGHEARAGEGAAHAPRPEPARGEPGLRRPRVRPPQEGRPRAADGDRAPRRQPPEHPHLVRGRREARGLRDRQGRDQGLEHRPRERCGASSST